MQSRSRYTLCLFRSISRLIRLRSSEFVADQIAIETYSSIESATVSPIPILFKIAAL